MPIPKYDEMYRAYLQCLADGRPHYFTDVKEKVAAAMNVTREEQRQMMTNRPVSLFDNRIGWTRTYLKKARADPDGFASGADRAAVSRRVENAGVRRVQGVVLKARKAVFFEDGFCHDVEVSQN